MTENLFSIEGLDGVGKSTVIQQLKKWLPSETMFLREPGGAPLSECLRIVLAGCPAAPEEEITISQRSSELLQRLLADSNNEHLKNFVQMLLRGHASQESFQPIDLSANDELLLFNAARAQLMDEVIEPALENKKTVILDRFIDSTIAYQGYGRGLKIDYVYDICLQATDGLLPKKTAYLRLSQQARTERFQTRGEKDRIEASGEDFFTRVEKGFDLLSRSERFRIIDAAQEPAQVSKDVFDAFDA